MQKGKDNNATPQPPSKGQAPPPKGAPPQADKRPVQQKPPVQAQKPGGPVPATGQKPEMSAVSQQQNANVADNGKTPSQTGEPGGLKKKVEAAKAQRSPDEQDKLIEVLTQQNEKLSDQYDVLKKQLDDLVAKRKAAKEEARHMKEEASKKETKEESQTKKDLDNAQKIILNYQKELKSIQSRIEANQTLEKITQLKNTLRDKERQIESLKQEQDMLEKIKRDQEKNIEVMKDDQKFAGGSLEQMLEEIKTLKTKLREMTEESRKKQRMFQAQQEYLVELAARYRALCARNGVSASLNLSKAQDQEESKRREISLPRIRPVGKSPGSGHSKSAKDKKSLQRSVKDFILAKDEVERKEDNMECNEANFKELVKRAKELKKEQMETEKKLKSEYDGLNDKIKVMTVERDTLKQKCDEKDMKVNILSVRLKEIERSLKAAQMKESQLKKDRERGDDPENGPRESDRKIKNDMPDKPKVEQNRSPQPPEEEKQISPPKKKPTQDKAKKPQEKVPEKQIPEDIDKLKNDEKGVHNREAVKFTDHDLLGEDYRPFRIIKVAMLVDPKSNVILGFQAFYKNIVKGNIIEGKKNYKDPKNEGKFENFECPQGDYLKSIVGQYNKNNEIESITLVSHLGTKVKFGAAYNTNAQTFALNISDMEVPICLYGSLILGMDPRTLTEGRSKLGTIGAEILRDEVPEKIMERMKS